MARGSAERQFTELDLVGRPLSAGRSDPASAAGVAPGSVELDALAGEAAGCPRSRRPCPLGRRTAPRHPRLRCGLAARPLAGSGAGRAAVAFCSRTESVKSLWTQMNASTNEQHEHDQAGAVVDGHERLHDRDEDQPEHGGIEDTMLALGEHAERRQRAPSRPCSPSAGRLSPTARPVSGSAAPGR